MSDQEFPKFLMIIGDQGEHREWHPLRPAAHIWDAGHVQVKMGDFVLEADFTERPITEEEKSRINDCAEEYSAAK